MYCEIDFRHSQSVSDKDVVSAISGAGLGKEMKLEDAYSSSARYRSAKPASALYAHYTLRDCFVILRAVYGDTSSFHLEALKDSTPVLILMEVAEEYSQQLRKAFSTPISTPGEVLAIRVFENTGNQAGVGGRVATARELFARQFAWKEVKAKVVVVVATWLLVFFGLEERLRWKAAVATLGVALAFELVEFIWKCSTEKGKIIWEVKR